VIVYYNNLRMLTDSSDEVKAYSSVIHKEIGLLAADEENQTHPSCMSCGGGMLCVTK